MITNRDVIYQVFFETKEKQLYYNQLKELTSLSYSSLQNVLQKLIENKELTEIKTKSHKFYSLTSKYRAIEFAKITLDRINNLNVQVKIPIQEFISKIPNNIYTCIFFGSASRGEEKDTSDIDLLVVLHSFKNKKLQELYNNEIKTTIETIKEDIETRSIYPISIGFTTKENLLKNNDYLTKQAIQTGYPLIHQVQYYQENEY